MTLRGKHKKQLIGFLTFLLLIAFLSLNAFAVKTSKASKGDFILKLYEYIEPTGSSTVGAIGDEITSIYPGQKFIVTLSLDDFNNSIGFSGIDTILQYDSGVLNYLGIESAGLSQTDPVGGNENEITQFSKDVFDLGFIPGQNNSKLSFDKGYYNNILIEYSSKLDHSGASDKQRSILSNTFYDGNTFDKSKIFNTENSVSKNNVLSTYLFEVKSSPVRTNGLNILNLDEDGLVLAYYTGNDLASTDYYQTNDSNPDKDLSNKINPPLPQNPEIATMLPSGITDTIDHDAGTRTVTVRRLSSLQFVPKDTTIKVYAPDGTTLLAEETAAIDGEVVLNINRSTDSINALINLGGSYKISATFDSQKEGNKVSYNVIQRFNYILDDLVIVDILDTLDVGSTLNSLPNKIENVQVTYNNSTGLETGSSTETVDVGSWSFSDTTESSLTPGVKDVNAVFNNTGNIVNKDSKYKVNAKVDIRYLNPNQGSIILNGGNARNQDMESGEATSTTMYVYVGFGFRDSFTATDRNGLDITSRVKRTVNINGTDRDLLSYTPNEKLTFFTDNKGDSTSYVKKTFTITYSYVDVDGITLTASRKVILTNRLGDINRDGTIDNKDSKLVNDYVLSILSTPPPFSNYEYFFFIADADGNNVIDLSDASYIGKHNSSTYKINQYYTFLANDENINN